MRWCVSSKNMQNGLRRPATPLRCGIRVTALLQAASGGLLIQANGFNMQAANVVVARVLRISCGLDATFIFLWDGTGWYPGAIAARILAGGRRRPARGT